MDHMSGMTADAGLCEVSMLWNWTTINACMYCYSKIYQNPADK
jgi:hypothetical protein